jgi:hypothetical protein
LTSFAARRASMGSANQESPAALLAPELGGPAIEPPILQYT